MQNKKKAFSMAELTTVVALLGVVAAITIPSVVTEHRENIKRVKLKRAMAYYESIFRKIAVDNNIMSDSKFDSTIDTCLKKKSYFKTIETADNNDCIFRTAEGLWWNVQNFKKPIVASSYNELSDTNKRYEFSGHIKDGVLHINELSYITDDNEKNALQKTYNYINKKK